MLYNQRDVSCSRNTSITGQPNILLIVLDDAGWNDFGYHGSEIKTPNIDRMAREGVELDQFYAYHVCTLTRAALLTGKPPSRSGVVMAIGADTDPPLPRDAVTVAELLGRQGYDTAITGKWHLGNSLDMSPIGCDADGGSVRKGFHRCRTVHRTHR